MKSARQSLATVFLAFAATVFALEAIASADPSSISELARGADAVILGRVSEKRVEVVDWVTRFDNGQEVRGEDVRTIYAIDIDRILQGELNKAKVDVYTAGGEINGRVMEWSIGISLEVGDEVVVFAKIHSPNQKWIIHEHKYGTFLLDRSSGAISVSSLADDGHSYISHKQIQTRNSDLLGLLERSLVK